MPGDARLFARNPARFTKRPLTTRQRHAISRPGGSTAWTGLFGGEVGFHGEGRVSPRVLERNEVTNFRDGELLHQDPASGRNDSLPDGLDVIDAKGALEAVGRFVVEKLAALLDRSNRGLAALVHDLREAGWPVVLELPAED